MRARGVIAGAAALAVVGSGLSSPARASEDGQALNGTYTAFSNGDWAKTNDSYWHEASVTSTWTITTTCTDPVDCTGVVHSDQGWTAPLHYAGDQWILDRDIPNWEPCPDGTAYTGHQKFRFWPVDPATGQEKIGSPLFAGEDRTLGPSGACGKNLTLEIRMPFRLEKVG